MIDFLAELETELTAAAERRVRRRRRLLPVAAAVVVAAACAAAALAIVPRGGDDVAAPTTTQPFGREVAVLNGTRIDGLAGRVADALRGDGPRPRVGSIGQWRRRESVVTFRERADAPLAEAVAARLGGLDTEKSGMSFSNLRGEPPARVTVFVGRDLAAAFPPPGWKSYAPLGDRTG